MQGVTSKDLPVSNRNTRIMANFVRQKMGPTGVQEIFKDLAFPSREGGIAFQRPEDFFTWEFGWHSLDTYNDAYLKLRELFGPEVYKECGATVGRFVDLGTMKNMKYALGGVEGALNKVPEINKVFNDTKDFIILDGPTREGNQVEITYIIRFHDDIDPHMDWKSDPHIQGILSQTGCPWALPAGTVVQPLVPYSLEKLCEKEFEFQRLDLDPKILGDSLVIRDPITKKEKLLAERVSLLPARVTKERAEAILPQLFGAPIFDGSWDRTLEGEYSGFRTLEDLEIENIYKKEDGKNARTTLIPRGTILAEGLYFVTRYSGLAASRNPFARVFHAAYYKYLEKGGGEDKDWVDAHMRLVEENKAKEKALRDYSDLVENLEVKVKERTEEIKNKERELLQANKMAAIGDLASGISHQYNNLTRTIEESRRLLIDSVMEKDKIINLLFTSSFSVEDRDNVIRIGEEITRYFTLNDTLPSDEIEERSEDLADQLIRCKVINAPKIAEDITRLQLGEIGEKGHLEFEKRIIEFVKAGAPYVVDVLSAYQKVAGHNRKIRMSNQSLFSIARSLKEYSRNEQSLSYGVDIHKGLENIIEILGSHLGGVELMRDYQAPPIDCYENLLQQAYQNLIMNAVQAMEGKGFLSIKTYLVDQDNIAIQFKDTGCGIPEENIGRLFDPYFTTKDKSQGSGRGLSMAYNIIKSHQGRIEVDSKIGKGTTFTLFFPRHQNEPEISKSL